jgi:hypothetical protein
MKSGSSVTLVDANFLEVQGTPLAYWKIRMNQDHYIQLRMFEDLEGGKQHVL